MVTGGAGFIGGHLVSTLVNLGAKVAVPYITIDRRSTFALERLADRVSAKRIDIRSAKAIESFIAKTKPSIICHLAAESLVTDAYREPVRAVETNIMGTVNILEASRRHAFIEKIIVASSDKAYGKTTKPYRETAPLAGDHPYDASKSGADLLCRAYFRTYRTPVIVTRFGNVYGEGDTHLERLVPGLCAAIANKRVFQIRSNGKYVRDYIYVDDVIRGYLLLLRRNDPKMLGEAYNFSSKDTLSVMELVRTAETVLGQKVRYKILNTAKNEIPYQHLVDQKIRKLGWKRRHTFSGTIGQVFSWYKRYY